MDPLAFRLQNLNDDAAARRAGGGGREVRLGKREAGAGPRLRPGVRHREGRLRRHVRRSGRRPRRPAVQVVRVVAAFECGAIVNPDHLRNQVEGAISRASAARSSRPSPSRTAGSSTRVSPTIACRGSATCRRSRPCWSTARTFRPRAQAKHPSWASLPRSATRSSTRPASGCGPCRSFLRDCRCHRAHRDSPASASPSSSIAIEEGHREQCEPHADESQDAIDPAEHGEIDEEHLHDGDAEQHDCEIADRHVVTAQADSDGRGRADRPGRNGEIRLAAKRASAE